MKNPATLLVVAILFQGFNILVGEEIVCSFLNELPYTLTCTNNKVIDVVAMKVGYVDDNTSCDEIKKRMIFGGEFSQCFEDIPFELCNGERYCRIKRDDIPIRWFHKECEDDSDTYIFSGDPYHNVESNILFLNYSCHDLNNAITLPTKNSNGKGRPGRVIDLITENIKLTRLPRSVTCEIKRQRDSSVRLVVKLVRFDSTIDDCENYLSLTDSSGKQYDVCNNNLEEINHELQRIDLDCPFKITFIKQSDIRRIKFWIQFSADKRFHMKCYEQVPQTDGFYTNSDDCPPNQPVSPEEPTTHPDSTEEGKNSYSETESNTGNIIPGVIGGLVGCILLIILITFFTVHFRKRSQKESPQPTVTPSAPPEESVFGFTGATNNLPTTTSLETPKPQKTSYDNAVSCVSDENEYLTLCEPEDTTINNDADEIIMSENDELYLSKDTIEEISRNFDRGIVADDGEHSAAPDDREEVNPIATKQQEESDGDYTKLGPRENFLNNDNTQYQMLSRKISEDKESNDNDSVIMFENNELYSSSVDLTKDEEDRRLEKEFNSNMQLEDDETAERITRSSDPSNEKDNVTENLPNIPKNRQSFV